MANNDTTAFAGIPAHLNASANETEEQENDQE
jgi:hypothetical protein